eukprot:gnl/TRDRNA2_/TRDRNA2_188488_c0_seq1.p1 gnl/TRDRNA2_/TRDRNA2_188488_c0~~gnl/TRDRNA2_/TRDRNA2_188488_c0_seq1.p1  ORF type:complete len:527 (-),score=137.95 gnl/TRDRNA2_/TRDRNA2_188488_c0_seq1:126-1706(-)
MTDEMMASTFAPGSQDSFRVPAPRVPPKGLSGLLDGYDAEAYLDTSKFPANMVLLNVYNLAESEAISRINKVTTANNNVLVGGVFHAGVEVYGREWCYGFTDDGSSGVRTHIPRGHPAHTYRATVPMGCTQLSEEETDQLLLRLSHEWPGSRYHVLRNNCLSFCNASLAELGLNRMPGWVDRAQRAAVTLQDNYKTVAENTNQTVQLVRGLTADLEQKARDKLEEAPSQAQLLERLEVEKAAARELLQERTKELQDTARVRTKELHEIASERAQELQSQAQVLHANFGQWWQDWRETTSDNLEREGVVPDNSRGYGDAQSLFQDERFQEKAQQAQEVALELQSKAQEKAQEVQEAAQEAASKAQEHVQALGASLMQWGEQMQKTNSWAQGLGGLFGSEGREAPKPAIDTQYGGQWGTAGMIKAQEDRLLSEGLLDNDSDDDDFGYIGQPTIEPIQPNRSAGRKEVEQEAPEDWLSTLVPEQPKVVPMSTKMPGETLDDLIALDQPAAPKEAPAQQPKEAESVDLLG